MPYATALGVLRLGLLACAAVTLTLGVFALAGDRLGLWKPLPEPGVQAITGKAHVKARAVPATSAAPGPPVPADLALLVGGAAAAVAVLASLWFRFFRLSRGALAHVSVSTPGWLGRQDRIERLRAVARSLALKCRRGALALSRLLAYGVLISWLFLAHGAVALWLWATRSALPAVRSRAARDARSLAERLLVAFGVLAQRSGRIAVAGGHAGAAFFQLIGNGVARVIHFRYRRHISRSRRQDLVWGVCAAVCALAVAFVVVTLGPR
jgi:hypothetical protein